MNYILDTHSFSVNTLNYFFMQPTVNIDNILKQLVFVLKRLTGLDYTAKNIYNVRRTVYVDASLNYTLKIVTSEDADYIALQVDDKLLTPLDDEFISCFPKFIKIDKKTINLDIYHGRKKVKAYFLFKTDTCSFKWRTIKNLILFRKQNNNIVGIIIQEPFSTFSRNTTIYKFVFTPNKKQNRKANTQTH